jgi:hypothetical protein
MTVADVASYFESRGGVIYVYTSRPYLGTPPAADKQSDAMR